jgi:beta-glucosidase
VSRLSLSEQAALGSGADFWTTKAVADVPALTLTDGPHGVRRQLGGSDHLGLAGSEPATCFPPAVGLAQTWDPTLARRVGAAIGVEARALGVDVVLGPGINIKRDPRGGRNFEYFSEDPLLSGVLGAAWVEGVQDVGVGASVKHFAVNNQEHDRMRVDVDVDARTLREIYLRAFHRVVTRARPWTVMASYNRINGVWAAENRWLLTDLLRGEWGFDGVAVSDWGAVVDRVRSVAAGLDLTMPGAGPGPDDEVVEAVESGALAASDVALCAERMAALARRAAQHRRPGVVDHDAHHELAREVARRAIVLLRNDTQVLPLRPETRIAVVGEFARTPRFQGGGSSRVNPTRVDVPLEEIEQRSAGEVVFAAGGAEAVRAAADADVAVVFLGLGEEQESEGFDRPDIALPAEQVELLRGVLEVQPATVVVLMHGGVVDLSDVTAPAVLDAALTGQGCGAAIADVLFGLVNPSGRLAETVPLRLQDTPAYLGFPGESGRVRYGEGVFVGHRWYDSRDWPVRYPFGHGLSYTTFAHHDLEVSFDGEALTARVTVTNSGARAGREVVQFYAGLPGSRVARAPRSLIGFVALDLDPGQSAVAEIRAGRDELAYWDVRVDDWVLEGGVYRVDVGASSRDIRGSAEVFIPGDQVAAPLSLQSTLREVAAHPEVLRRLGEVMGSVLPADADGGGAAAMMADIPLDRLPGFTRGSVTLEQLAALLED